MQINEVQIQEIIDLINKSLTEELTTSEQLIMQNWLNQDEGNKQLFSELRNPAYRRAQLQEMAEFTDEDKALANFLNLHKPTLKVKRSQIVRYITVAAAIVLIIGSGLYLYYTRQIFSDNPQVVALADVNPGKHTASLILGNGETIKLSEAKKGVFVTGSSFKYDDGSIVVQPGVNLNNIETLTARTPRGGTYMVNLPDGTKVWLNSESSLKFPATFANKHERKVELNGEAYFEVSKDKKRPFTVLTSRQEVSVLGTHFNVSAYTNDAATTTTLIEGSINILNRHSKYSKLLFPNQQAVVDEASLSISAVDALNAIDWKNGDFIFKNERLESIMRKVARWYDVDVVYKNKTQKEVVLGGMISRSKKLSSVLRFIESTGKVHFQIQGKTVIVTY